MMSTEHPDWCDNSDCRGEHWRTSDEYVPASAGWPSTVSSELGAVFPALGVNIARSDIEMSPPTVLIHAIDRSGLDEEYRMRVTEALDLALDLLDAAITLVQDQGNGLSYGRKTELFRAQVQILEHLAGNRLHASHLTPPGTAV